MKCFQVKLGKLSRLDRYFEVFIWNTQKEYSIYSLPNVKNAVNVACICWLGRNIKKNEKIAELHFCKKHFDWSSITHELLHLCFDLYGLMYPKHIRRIEQEKFCELLGFIVEKWCNALRKAGFRG